MKVRVGSRRVRIPIPEGVEAIQIERPWIVNGDRQTLIMRSTQTDLVVCQPCRRVSEPLAVAGGQSVEVLCPAPDLIRPEDVPLPRRRLWPVVRRILTETRDRAYPYLLKPVGRLVPQADPGFVLRS